MPCEVVEADVQIVDLDQGFRGSAGHRRAVHVRLSVEARDDLVIHPFAPPQRAHAGYLLRSALPANV